MKFLRLLAPNSLTSMNLLLGVLGIVFAFETKLEYAAFCILIAAGLDFLDGFVARLVKGNSAFGLQLDSLADLVTFGVLPGVMMYQFICISQGNYFTPIEERSTSDFYLSLTAFIIPLAGALRLAKFNIDQSQQYGFKGLPTPAVALMVAYIPLMMGRQFKINFYSPIDASIRKVLWEKFLYEWEVFITDWVYNTPALIAYCVMLALLMVIPIPLMAMKFKSFDLKENFFKYILAISALLLVVTVDLTELYYTIIPIIFMLYLITSFANGIIRKQP